MGVNSSGYKKDTKNYRQHEVIFKDKKSNIGTVGTHSIKFLLFMSISYSGIRAQNIKKTGQAVVGLH